MIKFLCDQVAVPMTALDKDNFKHQGFSKKWDTTKHLSYYIKYISNFVEKLEARDIDRSKDEKLMAARRNKKFNSGVRVHHSDFK